MVTPQMLEAARKAYESDKTASSGLSDEVLSKMIESAIRAQTLDEDAMVGNHVFEAGCRVYCLVDAAVLRCKTMRLAKSSGNWIVPQDQIDGYNKKIKAELS